MQRKDKGGDAGLRREDRSTRGKRMRAALEDESEGDNEFWNQDFWAEEAVDEDFKSEEEKEEEDVPDSDFDEPEDDEEDEEVEDKPMKDDAPKRKAPKAPEIKAPAKSRAPPKPKPTLAEREEAKLAALESVEAPTLRKSTKARTAEAAQERKFRLQTASKRSTPRRSSTWQPLTQAELLAEAARTEVENIQSLKLLMAMEEATKRKAAVVKQHYTGPTVKFVSRKRLKEQPPEPLTAPGPPALSPPTPAATQAVAAQPPPPAPAATQAVAEPPPAPAPAAAPAAAGESGAASTQGQPPVEAASIQEQTPAAAAHPTSETPAAPSAAPPPTQKEDNGSAVDADTQQGAAEKSQGEGEAASTSQEDAAAEAEAAAAKAAKDLENDGRRYEGTVHYEICNMPYPPMWLRRFRALLPPPPQLCAITGLPARYKDPETGRPFANTAAYRRLHPERQVVPSQALPLDQARRAGEGPVLQGESAPLPEVTHNTGGGRNHMGSSLIGGSKAAGDSRQRGCRDFLYAAAHTASRLLPPEPDELPEPSTHFPLVPPMALPTDMVALVTELHGPA